MHLNHLRTSVVNTYWLVAGAICLLGCTPEPEASKPVKSNSVQHSGSLAELRFDRRYLDSIALGPPYSERTKREMAIQQQLNRLDLYKYGLKVIAHYDSTIGKDDTISDESVKENIGYKSQTFSNDAAHLADIYQKMDSLKVLEHIPLTPYPKLK